MNTSKKRLSTKSKVIILIIAAIVLAALAFGINYLVGYFNYVKDVAAMQAQSVDLSTIEDGEYFGDCDIGLVRVKVRVVVKGQVITEVELLEHYNGRGESAEVLPGRILEEQRIDVDVISGATSSSNAILEAVYNALTGQRTIQQR